MLCPIDQSELVISDRQGVEIDYCPKCRGVWLDRGELDKIIDRVAPTTEVAVPTAATDRGRLAPAPQQSYRRDDDDDDDDRYDDDRRVGKKRKKESFLGNLFDF